MDFSLYGKKMQKYLLQLFRHYFIRTATVKSPQSSRFLNLFCQTTIIEMPPLNRYEKITCEN